MSKLAEVTPSTAECPVCRRPCQVTECQYFAFCNWLALCLDHGRFDPLQGEDAILAAPTGKTGEIGRLEYRCTGCGATSDCIIGIRGPDGEMRRNWWRVFGCTCHETIKAAP